MSSRPRSPRANRPARQRTLRPRLENLEIRQVLSTQGFTASPNFLVYTPPGGSAAAPHMPSLGNLPGPLASSMTPAQMRAFYEVDQILFGKIVGDGTGQTIAIVDAYDMPTLFNSVNGQVTGGDLYQFDKYFGLSNSFNFTKVGQTGDPTKLPGADPSGGWEMEEALDVEWAHAIAPGADIVLVEANSAFGFDLHAAEATAANWAGVSVVSNSWGRLEYPQQANEAQFFTTPAGHQGVTFLASTGDSGSSGTLGTYPAGNPVYQSNVVAVGGTSIYTQNGAPSYEGAWNLGGGGTSLFTKEPAYQQAVQNTGYRTVPDVSMDADSLFGGVAIYDSYLDFGLNGGDPWYQIGGTSLSCPMWAGLIAIANQGRVAAGGTTLDGVTQTLPALYSLPSYDFNDVVMGNNEGYQAGVGYDQATGRGTPKANLLVPDLATYGLATPQNPAVPTAPTVSVALTNQPPTAVDPGSSFGLTAAVRVAFRDANGVPQGTATDIQFNGTATLYDISSGTPVQVTTAPVTNGYAVFDGLTLQSGKTAQYQISVSIGGTNYNSLPSNKVTTLFEPANTETLTPAASYASLNAALQRAASDTATNITIQLESGIYALDAPSAAALTIQNTSALIDTKNITIVGDGASSTIIEPSRLQGWGASIFQVIGQAGHQVNLTIKGLTISGGEATGGGVLGGTAARGGGILINGANVTLNGVTLSDNMAVGKAGTPGAAAARKRKGGTGGAGAPAIGGGLYMAGGQLTLNGVTFKNDYAFGGKGGTGGLGGTDGGSGGVGGVGGYALGGGAYVAGGVVSGANNLFTSDAAVGGSGGYGGKGGVGGTTFALGSGGRGGQAGSAYGGGLYVSGGAVTLTSTPISHDLAIGGHGGTGGVGGFSHGFTYFSSASTSLFAVTGPFLVGFGGAPGLPGDAAGGGLYLSGGSLTLGTQGAATKVKDQFDRAIGGYFGTSSGDTRLFRYGLFPFEHRAAMDPGYIRTMPSASTPGTGAGRAPAVGPNPLNWPGHVPAAGHPKKIGNGLHSVGFAEGGAMFIAGGSLTLFSQDISNNLANYGGGIYKSPAGTVFASGLSMKNNAAEFGGAISNSGGMTLKNAVITNNKAALGQDAYEVYGETFVAVRGSSGGAIGNFGKLGLVNVTVSSNSAVYGGAIYNDGGTVTATNLKINKNAAVTRGGGIYSLKGSLTIAGGTIDDNTVSGTGTSLSVAVGSGGGIDMLTGKLNLTGITMSGNVARAGGAIYLASGTATIVGATTDISDNTARQYGGAIYNQGTVSIGGGTLSGNSARFDGGVVDNFGALTVDGAILSGNMAGKNGGAINNPSVVTLSGATITNNSAGGLGGGIDSGGELTADSSTLSNNTASSGGGLFDVGQATLKSKVALTGNVAVVDGGGIYEGSGGQVNATSGLNVLNNVAQQGNGGGIFDKRGALSIFGGEISGNSAPANRPGDTHGWGGGVFDSGGKVVLTNTPVEKNSAVYGGGIYINAGSVSLQDETLDQNQATRSGGALWNLGTLTLTTSFVTGNTAAQGDGGGIENNGKLTITNSTLGQNVAAAGMGGDMNNGVTGSIVMTQSTLTAGSAGTGGNAANSGSLTISTSTLSYGSASGNGGGIANLFTGTARLNNTTIAANTASGRGGGIETQGTLTVVNATIAYNAGLAGPGAGVDIAAGAATLVNSIVDSNTGATEIMANEIGGTPTAGSSNNLIGVANPDLGPLKNNGGPTLTIALLPGSPAIDYGSNALALDPTTKLPLSVDQRGALRGGTGNGLNAGGAVDAGAFEASSSYMITSTADSLTIGGTLRSGLDWAEGSFNYNPANIAAPAPNTLTFNTGGTFAVPQTITLTSALPKLTSKTDPLVPGVLGPVPIEVQGPGGGVVTISGNDQFQVFAIDKAGQAILQGLTVTGGTATQGGGIENHGILSLNNMTLSMNTATSTGGGVFSDGSLSIDGGSFQKNSASTGGGVFASAGSMTISNAMFVGNSAVSGGGIFASAGKLTITDATVTGNSASGDGGGMAAFATGTATITGGIFSNNAATYGGGLELQGAATITGTSFTGNSASMAAGGNGGAIYLTTDTDSGVGRIDGSALTFSGNIGYSGGAIYNNLGTVNITASAISGNSANASGGGIENLGTLSVSATTMSGNSASGGGAIANGGLLSVNGSTLSGNSAANGGGISDVGGLGDILANATLAGNSASAGGGIYSDSSVLTLLNTTVAYNTASTGGAGAGVQVASGSIAVYNSIVDLNLGAGTTDIAGTYTGSNSLVGVINPGLASGLADNGGPTQTIALLAGSPALNGGAWSFAGGPTVPATDQRGAVRGGSNLDTSGLAFAGATPDVGSFEASSEYQVTTFDGAAPADTKDLFTLRTAVGWANVSQNANLPTPASEPNTVAFAATGTITLSPTLGTLELSNAVTPVALDNTGNGAVAISGGKAVGVLQVDAGVAATLTNLTIRGGSASAGAGINNLGGLTLDGTTVMGNTAKGSGGGINNAKGATLTLTSSSMISGNTAGGSGGGINNSGTLTLGTGSTISSNSASINGGGIADFGTLTLNAAQVIGNSAAAGGGIVVGGTLTDTGSTFSGNAGANGGGIAVQSTGTATLTNTIVVGNAAAGTNGVTGSGGGIDNSGILTLKYANIGQSGQGNTASSKGGGISNETGSKLTVSYSTVTGNSAQGSGGGLYNAGTATVSVLTVSANSSASSGGGIRNGLGGLLNLGVATLSGNTGTQGGGLSNGGTANVNNATIAGNQGSDGAGVYGTGVLTIINGTIAYNTATTGGSAGGLDAAGGSTALYNTIVALNTIATKGASDAVGSLAPTSAFDLFGTGGSGGLTPFNGIQVNVKSPALDALANNGGPTQTIALLQGSPAIDAGNSTIVGITTPAVDQRGALRGAAGLYAGQAPDIGAFEASSSYRVNTTTDSNDMGTLRQAIAWANLSTNNNPANLHVDPVTKQVVPTVAANTAVFDTAGAFATPQTITVLASLNPIALSNSAVGVAIDGTASNGLTISGGGQAQMFTVAPGTSALLTGLTISGGSSTTSGGAISNAGNLTITNSTLTGNTAQSGGGAIDNLGTLVLESSTLNVNSAGQSGGAIAVEPGGTLTATNTTLTGNTAAQGGAVYSAGNLTMVNDTIAYNTVISSGSGGGLDAAGGSASLYNTIVAGNTRSVVGTPADDDIAGTVLAASANNLIGPGGSGGLSGTANGNILVASSQDAGLGGGLGANGGPTQTIALNDNSPAVGKGAAPGHLGASVKVPTIDQRGAARLNANLNPPVLSNDIGAYQVGSPGTELEFAL